MGTRKARLSPAAIARWRYDRIEPALGEMTHDVRGEVIREIHRVPVLWPNGVVKPISVPTLYRWVERYQDKGLAGLRPTRRKDFLRMRARLTRDILTKARELLEEDPGISWTFLVALLHADRELGLAGRGVKVSRSTLHRHLTRQPFYAALKRARHKARRTRYVARRPHGIWHLDAKGPVSVRLASGETVTFHVLTVLDDASRAALAALVASSPNLCAAVRVFRLASKRWGLPDKLYVDRASVFDSYDFRTGLAELGCHRVKAKSGNPEANGKIEAYHRTMGLWFFGRLAKQRVADLVHLQQLMDGVIEVVYQDHHLRGLKASPRGLLANEVSARQVSAARLDAAFRKERDLKAHPVTGEVVVDGFTYLVPDALRGRRLTFRADPEPGVAPLVVHPGTGEHVPCTRAAVAPSDLPAESPPRRWADGPLQTLYDSWQGKTRPVAEPGFGLPEVYTLLADAVGRSVPRSEAEAALIQRTWREIGPLPHRATTSAFKAIRRALGPGRPIDSYLQALRQRVIPSSQTTHKPKRRARP